MRDCPKEKILCDVINRSFTLRRTREKIEAQTIDLIKRINDTNVPMKDDELKIMSAMWDTILYQAAIRYTKISKEKILISKWFPKKNRDDMARNIVAMMIDDNIKK